MPEIMVGAVGSLHLPAIAVIFLLLIAYLILGSVFEEISAIPITLPFVLPFIVADLVVLFLLMLFSGIALWLPHLIGN